jgi:hypothetical protein
MLEANQGDINQSATSTTTTFQTSSKRLELERNRSVMGEFALHQSWAQYLAIRLGSKGVDLKE